VNFGDLPTRSSIDSVRSVIISRIALYKCGCVIAQCRFICKLMDLNNQNDPSTNRYEIFPDRVIHDCTRLQLKRFITTIEGIYFYRDLMKFSAYSRIESHGDLN